MTRESQILRSFINESISPTMKLGGFKKHRFTWNLKTDQLTIVMDIQAKDNFAKFTVNFGVWMRDFWEVVWNKEPPVFIKETDCFPRFRIGKIIGKFEQKTVDKWWRLNEIVSSSDAKGDFLDTLFKICIPEICEIKTRADVLILAEKLPMHFPLEHISYAILKYFNGDREWAQRRLVELSSHVHWGERASGALQRLLEKSPDMD